MYLLLGGLVTDHSYCDQKVSKKDAKSEKIDSDSAFESFGALDFDALIREFSYLGP